MPPLVSCICPTKERRKYLPGVIDDFMRQDYPNKELILIGDAGNLTDLIPEGETRIWYGRLGLPAASIGRKRNAACELARGIYICHWDDDDIYMRHRISEQVDVLQQTGKAVTGYRDVMFRDETTGRMWMFMGGSRYAVGVSLFYRRSFWQSHQFPDSSHSEDNEWLNGVREDDIVIRTGAQIIARIHSDNTCPKSEEIQLRNRDYWREIK